MISDKNLKNTMSRRDVLAATTLAAATLVSSGSVRPSWALTGSGAAMRDYAVRFLGSLDETQMAEAFYTFDDTQRRRWNYMLGSRPAPGVRLENMNDTQKSLALDLLKTGLSEIGLETAMNVMLQQDILRDEWQKGSPDRNRERFSVMIFGRPSATDLWSWRFEGHHLTLTFTLLGDDVISHTPKAFSSEPNTVPSGPHKGLVVLPENETLGRAVFAEMNDVTHRKALLRETSIGNVTATAGREFRYTEKEGIALGDLRQPQADKILRLVDLYTKDHLAGEVLTTQERRFAQEDPANIHFAWAGPNLENESLYYRIHGDTFLIEFATLRGQPQHHHTVVHDLQHNLGMHKT